MERFEYASPTSLAEATSLLTSNWNDAAILAGGTDILNCLKDHVYEPKRLVNIKNIKELSGVRKAGTGLHIGATTTFDDLARNNIVRTEYPALHEAVLGVASPQIRNMGTAGGDLCQRPRCWYFRSGYGLLAKDQSGKSLVPTGENQYHSIFSTGPAYFVSASSLGPALVALGASVRLVSKSGSRDVPVAQFFVAPESDGAREIALLPNEILTEIIVPAASGVKSATYEIRQREAIDWPLATASVALKMQGKTVSSAKIVLGHVGPTPVEATEAEALLAGKTVTPELAAEAGKAAVAKAKPLSRNGYKVQLASVAVKRALSAAVGLA